MRIQGTCSCLLACLLLAGCVGPAPPAQPQGANAQEAAAASRAVDEARGSETVADAGGTELSPDACATTEEGAWAFLNQFVRSSATRQQYTSAGAVESGIDPAQFHVGNVDNRWVYVDPALDVADYPRVDLKLVLAGNKFDLEYTKARFSDDEETVEPYGGTGRYTFEFGQRCWELVAQTPMH